MQLTIINRDGKYLVDSREVAEMTETRHDHLLAKIDGYIKVIYTDPNFRVSDLFQLTSGRYKGGNELEKRQNWGMTINQMREEEGLDRHDDPAADAVMTPVNGTCNQVSDIYFLKKTVDCQIPDDILAEVKSTFTAFTMETRIDGTVVIRVPKSELEAVEKFKDAVFSMIVDMRKENDVLAGKLARRYGF